MNTGEYVIIAGNSAPYLEEDLRKAVKAFISQQRREVSYDPINPLDYKLNLSGTSGVLITKPPFSHEEERSLGNLFNQLSLKFYKRI